MTDDRASPAEGEVQAEIERISELVETGMIEAGARAAELVRRHPDSFDAHMFRGFVCNRLRDFEGALVCLAESLRLRPTSDAAHFNLGITHCQLGGLEPALEHFLAAAATAPRERQQSRVLAGCCHHRLGRPADAIPLYRQVLEVEPADASAVFSLMQALRETGDFGQADEWAENLTQMLHSNYPSVRALLGFFQGYDFDGWIEVDDKALLAKHVETYRREVDPAAFAGLPATYVMPDDYPAFAEAHGRDPGIWMVKPNNMHNGHGLRLIEFPEEASREAGWLVQRYLGDPFLFRGRKASFRISLLVTSVSPPRVYLFHGGSARFSLQAYDKGRDKLGDLPMHVGHLGIFSDRTDLIEETARVMGNANSTWRFPELMNYIAEAGFDPGELWEKLQAQAVEVVELIGHIGLYERQAAHGQRYAYGPKIVGIDIFLDEAMRPWILEVERGPTFFRMFDGERENNPIFPQVTEMAIFPLGDGAADTAAREAEIEYERRGRFIRIMPGDD